MQNYRKDYYSNLSYAMDKFKIRKSAAGKYLGVTGSDALHQTNPSVEFGYV